MSRSAPQWAALSGGRTNRLWQVSQPGGDIVVKLFSAPDENPLFPNDPASEILVLSHPSTLEIGPHLLDHFSFDHHTCLVYLHLPGTPWQSNTTQAAALLHRLHQLPAPTGLRKAPDGSDALRQQANDILSCCPSARAEALRAIEPEIHVPASERTSFLHGDPVATNMILQGPSLKLIDWQCPAIGDPCEDISVFLSPAMHLTYRGETLSENEVSSFLVTYPDKTTVARYRKLAPWYHWRMAAYCLWQESRCDPMAARAGMTELDALRTAVTALSNPLQLA